MFCMCSGQCARRHVHERMSPHSHLQDLNLSSNEIATNIIALLSVQAFQSQEQLSAEDRWWCGRCQGGAQGFKSLQLSLVPEILVITLKRGVKPGSKLQTLVDFPVQGLHLAQYLGQEEVC